MALSFEKIQEKNGGVLGSSPAIVVLLKTVSKLKGNTSGVLLTGESGVGKEIFARAMYAVEENPRRPFVAVNCAAIPSHLMESTLFGHEKGSFTGAMEKRAGKFVLADGGDIFLDEIGCLSLELQAKLLRVLQEKEVDPVGASRPVKSNFRVIAATNQDLKTMIREGKFREDLFFRLCVVHLNVPALRSRKEDIPVFVKYFMEDPALKRYGKTVSEEALSILGQYPWPGNVRELKNTLENLVVICDSPVIDVADLPQQIVEGALKNRGAPKNRRSEKSVLISARELRTTMKNAERDLILAALERHRWRKIRVAQDLGISRSVLYRKMVILDIKDRKGK